MSAEHELLLLQIDASYVSGWSESYNQALIWD